MIAEFAAGTTPHFETDHVEFIAEIDGARQAFRVDARVFEEMLRVKRIGTPAIRNLFTADPEHFLQVAARKYGEVGSTGAPINITLGDLLS